MDALVRERAVQIRPTAELSLTGEQLPGSLAAALTDRLSSVPAETAQMLRTAALLGGRFAVTDLAVVLRRPVSDLVAGLQEAAAAGILAGSGAELVFRHPLIRQELPAALEDLAAVLAGHGHEEDARALLNEAVALYEDMQARWDIRRAEGRLRPYGIRRGVRGRRGPRAASGWEALTPTEIKIAALVARGDSTSDIAKGMFLSRRTVQTYISRILTKLGAKGRVEIVREALRHGVSP
jgi:DNA-binding CsgD family transcriptional regulator